MKSIIFASILVLTSNSAFAVELAKATTEGAAAPAFLVNHYFEKQNYPFSSAFATGYPLFALTSTTNAATHKEYKLVQEDAGYFIATQGEVTTAVLANTFERLRALSPELAEASDLELAILLQ